MKLPPGQQLVAAGKWPAIGERTPREDDSPWTVAVAGLVERPLTLSLSELRRLPSFAQTLDIHCVTRWSKLGAKFGGVPLAELLAAARPTDAARFISFVARSPRQHSSSLPLAEALRLKALLALDYEGQPLATDHGGPVRVVVPERYFYKSLKWLARIELLPEDRLGYWEDAAGYHNVADPWKEQRFVAARLSKQEAQAMITSRDFSGRDLLGLDCSGRDLRGLAAANALLRNADFRGCNLRNACFDGANLSNAHFEGAELREASFQGADLEGTNFAGADLRGANLSGASLFGATFIAETGDETGVRPAARFDEGTRCDPQAIADLTPLQQEYVRRFV